MFMCLMKKKKNSNPYKRMSVHILLFQYFYFNMSLSIHVFAGFLFIGDGTWPFINLISSIFNSSILSSCNLALEKRYPCNREIPGERESWPRACEPPLLVQTQDFQFINDIMINLHRSFYFLFKFVYICCLKTILL